MQLSQSLYVVGGGENGLGISERHDSAVYAVDLKSELVLIDAEAAQLLDVPAVIRQG